MNESNNTSTDTSEAIAASPRSGARLRKLFFETLYLSAFTFGGGYVIVSLLKKKFVDGLPLPAPYIHCRRGLPFLCSPQLPPWSGWPCVRNVKRNNTNLTIFRRIPPCLTKLI